MAVSAVSGKSLFFSRPFCESFETTGLLVAACDFFVVFGFELHEITIPTKKQYNIHFQ
ncbi:MAG: Uncharacterised protein [Flavobacteriales bacterium]|nr:MAG: Uncharacterised protein [Flavobacteriales bacterium]